MLEEGEKLNTAKTTFIRETILPHPSRRHETEVDIATDQSAIILESSPCLTGTIIPLSGLLFTIITGYR